MKLHIGGKETKEGWKILNIQNNLFFFEYLLKNVFITVNNYNKLILIAS